MSTCWTRNTPAALRGSQYPGSVPVARNSGARLAPSGSPAFTPSTKAASQAAVSSSTEATAVREISGSPAATANSSHSGEPRTAVVEASDRLRSISSCQARSTATAHPWA